MEFWTFCTWRDHRRRVFWLVLYSMQYPRIWTVWHAWFFVYCLQRARRDSNCEDKLLDDNVKNSIHAKWLSLFCIASERWEVNADVRLKEACESWTCKKNYDFFWEGKFFSVPFSSSPSSDSLASFPRSIDCSKGGNSNLTHDKTTKHTNDYDHVLLTRNSGSLALGSL